MGGELSIDTDFVRWFKGYGPRPVLGPCPHDCAHRSLSDIAWGPDEAHYTLDECRDCGCRAWIPVERDPKNRTKPRSLFAQARWMQVEVPPPISHVVRLLGGPMDGWLVKPGAPVLEPTWNPEGDGAYIATDPDEDGVPQAVWTPRERP